MVLQAVIAPPEPLNPLLDPNSFAGGTTPVVLGESAPLASEFRFTRSDPPIEVAASESEVDLPPPPPDASPLVADVPVPTPRPPDLQTPVVRPPLRAPSRQFAQRGDPAVLPSSPVDHRSFFEKVFGLNQAAGPALGYAAPEEGLFGSGRRLTDSPARAFGAATAVYEIASHTVYMPDGAQLEAHSGLGDRLDDVRYVHERMRGPTPPHIYQLTPREQLFHGVQALRLNPVGGGNIFGRTGLLAHTYMLGPNGDSNGCVSFKNYRAFLQAFQNGDVKRLVVVARLN
ncbi:DUF2778 domain-containing protein [Lichenifustis flavocetrariae]|uniref:DUF2778 domain-containing protein n=1 Tax=Lichenifustis flavocetrariae TaxID=2949735 RepID=A0AA42CN66_9HYPH|nr:DUF2778 domain-containing protein [Lichenifustis flavocetrariae]MCW6509092.1 DUF2778 domain-containing protein [Lichenifustis flavocetrariae]